MHEVLLTTLDSVTEQLAYIRQDRYLSHAEKRGAIWLVEQQLKELKFTVLKETWGNHIEDEVPF